MSGWFALGAFIVAVATIQAALCALLAALALAVLKRRLETTALQGRVGPLLFVAGLPLLTSAALVVVCMGPPLLAAMGLGGDHCLAHVDHALHLCLKHLPIFAPTLTLGLVIAAGFAASLSALRRAGVLLLKGRGEARALAALAERRDDVGWIESRLPLALTVGLLRPRVYVSSALEAGLSDDELEAALAHERCHARERHALLKMLGTVVAMFHVPGVRRQLLELLDFACERRADEMAGRHTNRLLVASALVSAHRLACESRQTALAFADGEATQLERRVHALVVEQAPARPAWSMWAASGMLLAAVVANHELHHAVEHMLELLV